jgi:hypothetical protein
MPLILKRFLFPLLYAAFLFVFAFLFAPLGFNPTDDGVVLAQTARFWSGQVPFLDFVSIRPFGSVFLHWPELLFGDYRLLASRYLTILEVGFYSFALLSVTVKLMRVELKAFVFWLLAGISFALNIHSFPLMAWTTIDAIFILSLGLLIRTKVSSDSWWNIIAYSLLSMAALCRQTFLPVAFLSMWLFQDFRKLKAFVGIFVPYILFAIYLLIHGVIKEALEQMMISGTSIQLVLKVLLQYKGTYLGLLLGAILVIIWQRQKQKQSDIMGYIIVSMSFALAILTMALFYHSNSYRYLPSTIWICGLPILGSEMRFHRLSRFHTLGIFVLVVSGLTAISIGYPSPALIMAWPWLFILFWALKRFTPLVRLSWMSIISFLIVLVLSVLVRLNHIYREPRSEYLHYKTKHPGLKGIWMDKQTASELNELWLWKKHLKGKKAVLFDFAACRMDAIGEIPLKGDWLTEQEFPSKNLQNMLFKDVTKRQNRYWIVQKYCSAELCDTLVPIEARNDSMQIAMLKMISKRSIIYNEGKFFIIYRQ